jgi:hypothetical protein
MTGRGRPKLADLERLKSEAARWASFLFTLRDGQSGFIEKVTGWRRVEGKGFKVRRATGIVVVKIIPVERKTASKFIRTIQKLKDENWIVFRPTFPDPNAWEQLKRARSAREVQEAAQSIRRWERHFGPIVVWKELPKAIRCHGIDILKAKMLPNYPKSKRPRSDDKRILFFAKVMAGLTLGIAAATATKRLGCWSWPKDWAEKPLERLTTQYPMPRGKST